jgi:hemophore-related protein
VLACDGPVALTVLWLFNGGSWPVLVISAQGLSWVVTVGAMRGRSPQVINFSWSRVAVAVGGLALSFTAAAGVASADPDLGPIVNTTCSYPQVMSAMNAQDPATAAQFSATPTTDSFLRQFLASPPNQRMRMARMIQSSPVVQQNFGLIEQVFNTCSNY